MILFYWISQTYILQIDNKINEPIESPVNCHTNNYEYGGCKETIDNRVFKVGFVVFGSKTVRSLLSIKIQNVIRI